MAKLKRRIDITPGQGSIFEIIERVEKEKAGINYNSDFPGRLNLDPAIRELISSGLKKTSLSRYEVGAEMSKFLGRDITKAMLDSWSAESKDGHKFPLAYLNAFSKATGDRELLRLICNNAGGYYIENEDALRLELGKLVEQKKKLTGQERLIREYLESMGRKGK